MAVSEAQKKAAKKWDSVNMAVISCKLKKELADKFTEATRANGTTKNAVLLQAVRDYIATHDNETTT